MAVNLKKPRRMRFGTWCSINPNDPRTINYALTMEDGNVERFTSEDEKPYRYVNILHNAWIRSITLKDGEWYANLYVEV